MPLLAASDSVACSLVHDSGLHSCNQQKKSVLTALEQSQCDVLAAVCYYNWATTQQNLSSGFPTMQNSNQSPKLQRLAIKLKFRS